MSIIQEVQALKQASAQQVAASQALAQEVAGKMGQIDQKVNTSIAAVETGYAARANQLTIIARAQ